MKKLFLFLIILLGLGGVAYYFFSPSQSSDDQIQRVSDLDTISGHYESSYSGFTLDLVIENASIATLSVGASLASVSLNGQVDPNAQTIDVIIDNSLIASAFGVEEGVTVTAYYEQVSENHLNLTIGNVTLEFYRV